MKKFVLPLSVAIMMSSAVFGQSDDFSRDFSSVRSELTAWDPVRGEWLASSMEAMSNNQPIPDRNFPEQFTPAQMFDALPTNVRTSVSTKIATGNSQSTGNARQNWSRLSTFTNRTGCKPITGRSYGDPHIQSFDGSNMSFQTVGEYSLVESKSGRVRVQVRQKASGESFSLNSAVAMWVDGDRVGFYSSTRPDGNTSTPIRVNGEPVYPSNGVYYLNHGGIITENKGDYTVTWPTGERVQLDERGSGNGGFYNVAVEIIPCNDEYSGILGNANGTASDDFQRMGNPGIRTGNSDVDKAYLNYLAREFGDDWRVNESNTLFDYGFGQSPLAFYDPTFPRVHYTVDDMDPNRRDRARRECERRGFSGSDLNACVFDNGFMNIEPTPKPTPPPTRNPDGPLKPVIRPTPNVNPGRGSTPPTGTTTRPVTGGVVSGGTANPAGPVSGNTVNPGKGQGNPAGGTQPGPTTTDGVRGEDNRVNPTHPIDTKPVTNTDNSTNSKGDGGTVTKPVTPRTTEPTVKPTPAPAPAPKPTPEPRVTPRVEPRSEPRTNPSPAPRPTPAPAPRTNPTPAPRTNPSPAPAPRPSSPPLKRP